MDDSHQRLIAWLENAHAMERSLVHVLEEHAHDAKDFPELRRRYDIQLMETHLHIAWLVECLALVGAKPSPIKGLMGGGMGNMRGLRSETLPDRLTQNAISDYASEHFQIGCYRALIATAAALGQKRIVEICNQILADEVRMAAWIGESISDRSLPPITVEVTRPSAEKSHREKSSAWWTLQVKRAQPV
jgi:ferritin-like metal-binding protein YciE